MQSKNIGVIFLLALGMPCAFADGGTSLHAQPPYRLENITLERPELGSAPLPPSELGQNRGREFLLPDTGGYAIAPGNEPELAFDSSRRQGRLTLEQRRMLRQQIGEVGHDIYAPRN